MPGPCDACSHRSEYLDFRHRALELDASLGEQYPGGVDLGGLAFLGRHYAHSRSILLTLNPTPTPSKEFSSRLLGNNHHWEGAAKARYRNWTFARHLFRNMAASATWVSPAIAQMTDQFIVPWPSRDWVSMEKSPAWPTIREYSAELCRLSLRHHQPDLVFVSGKTTLRLFFQFMGLKPPKAADRRVPRNKSWACEWFRLEKGALPDLSASRLNLVRLPHFSRGGYKEFKAIGEWVAGTLQDTIPVNQAGT